MKNMTTLGKVFDRVDAMNQHCYDNLVDVSDISFDSLDAVKMGSDLHPLRTIAQKSITWRLGIPYQYLRKCSHTHTLTYPHTSLRGQFCPDLHGGVGMPSHDLTNSHTHIPTYPHTFLG